MQSGVRHHANLIAIEANDDGIAAGGDEKTSFASVFACIDS